MEGPAVRCNSASNRSRNALRVEIDELLARKLGIRRHTVNTIGRQVLQGNDAPQGIVEESVRAESRTGDTRRANCIRIEATWR